MKKGNQKISNYIYPHFNPAHRSNYLQLLAMPILVASTHPLLKQPRFFKSKRKVFQKKIFKDFYISTFHIFPTPPPALPRCFPRNDEIHLPHAHSDPDHTCFYMFNKIKLRKAPLSLSSVSNAIKSSGSANLTPEINQKHLKVVGGDQLGLPIDSIVAVAYDPVQSLFAVSTNRNSIHVYGQRTVEVVFELRVLGSVSFLRFVKGVYLVCVESSGAITVLSLHSKEILGTYLVPGAVSSVESDPCMDWLILGLNNGSLFFYDVDRLALTPMRVDNLQKAVIPKQKLSPVLSIQWHPRDMGTVLVAYSHCAVQYSLTGGGVKNAFVYRLEAGSKGFEHSNAVESGGKKKLFGSAKEVVPRLNEAHYHPNGLHIVTVHEDGTLAFWDANSATLLEARTVTQTGLHKPGQGVTMEESQETRVRWITGQDPELTLLLVCGASRSRPDVIDVLDFGYTLKYSLTSHEKQGEFYAKLGQRKIAIKFNRRLQDQGPLEYIKHMLPISAEAQPYFNGGHNPARVVLVSSLGAIYVSTLDENAPSILLPPGLAAIVPPKTFSTVQIVKRVDWFSVVNNRRTGKLAGSLLTGGAPVNKQFPRTLGLDENFHNIMISAHENGLVRLLDLTSGEFSDSQTAVHIHLKETLNTGESLSFRPLHVSCSFESRELVVGMANGNVAICKFTKPPHNTASGRPTGYEECQLQHENGNARIVDLSRRVLGYFDLPSFVPMSLVQLELKDKISCLKMCNAGFAAIAYKSGRLVVCDISRGPAVILNLDNITKHLPSVTGECYVTALEFAIMEYGQDGYSSLLLFAGTNAGGNFLTFKVVPQPGGGFDVVFADKTLGLNYKSTDSGASGLDRIMPINASNGASAVATLDMFQRLGQNILIPGYIVVSSPRDLRVLKLPKQKLAHKVVDETCVSCGIVNIRPKGAVLAALTESGFVKLFSLPALSDVADIKLPVDTYKRLQNALKGAATKSTVSESGELFVALSSSELTSLLIYDESKNKTPPKTRPTDLLFNENAIIPPRPSASALLWAKGQSTLVSSKDLAVLIAGPNRKAAKHPESVLAYNISPEANPNKAYGAYNGSAPGKEEAYAQPVRKATASNPYAFGSLGFMRSMRDGLDAMEEGVNNYASGISESMSDTMENLKQSFYSLALKSKFGF